MSESQQKSVWSKLPIAMLHHVSDRKDWDSLRPFVITKATFVRFLDAIEKGNFQPITFKQLQESSREPKTKEIIIGFDDCGRHLLDFAVPELIRRGMKATFYMPTAHIGGQNDWDVEEGRSAVDLMNRDELLELHQHGMEIGGHSHHHIHLGRVDSTALRDEVTACQTILTEIIGQPATSFAFPFGSLPLECVEEAAEIFRASHFHDACGIFCPSENRLQRRRFIVHDGDSSLTMRLKLSRIYAKYRSIGDPRKPLSAFL